MRIKIVFEPYNKNNIILPQHYNYLIQGFIYTNLKKHIAKKVHNVGFKYQKRKFRFFTFSRIFGDFDITENGIVYKSTCTIWIASPMTEILESFVSSLAHKIKVKLGDNYCQISAMEVPFTKKYPAELMVRTLSPITVYTTLYTQDQRKKTYYYNPFEDEFSKQIKENLTKKYTVLYGETDSELNFSIVPYKVSQRNEHVVIYKGTVVKAWSGIYKITGTEDLMQVAFDCGLGAKNSQGFGMIEEYKEA